MFVIQAASPRAVSAAACATSFAGGGQGGVLLSLSARLGPVDSSVHKVTTEFTPAQTWQDGSSSLETTVAFAKNDCTSANAYVSFSLVGKALTTTYYSGNHSGAFISGTDYKNLTSGVSVPTSSSTTHLSATYTTGSIATGSAQQLSVDLATDAGFADIYLKQGSGSEALLMSLKLPNNTSSFLTTNESSAYVSYSESTFSGETCSGITGSGQVAVRMLLDGTAGTLTAVPYPYATCANFDETSYNSGTKTATLRYNTTGKNANHVVAGLDSLKTASGDNVNVVTSLGAELSGESYYMSDPFIASNQSTQPVYFYVENYLDGKSTPKDIPYPIVGGVINFANTDLDLAAHDVSMDVSAANYSALAHNFGSLTTTGSFTLFAAQREGDDFVGVCPGATDINAVNTSCSDLYFLKNGETKNGATASLITVGTTKFWQVSGLTGTGVFSSTVGAIPGSPQTGTTQQSAKRGYIFIGSLATIAIFSKFRALRFGRRRR